MVLRQTIALVGVIVVISKWPGVTSIMTKVDWNGCSLTSLSKIEIKISYRRYVLHIKIVVCGIMGPTARCRIFLFFLFYPFQKTSVTNQKQKTTSYNVFWLWSYRYFQQDFSLAPLTCSINPLSNRKQHKKINQRITARTNLDVNEVLCIRSGFKSKSILHVC